MGLPRRQCRSACSAGQVSAGWPRRMRKTVFFMYMVQILPRSMSHVFQDFGFRLHEMELVGLVPTVLGVEVADVWAQLS